MSLSSNLFSSLHFLSSTRVHLSRIDKSYTRWRRTPVEMLSFHFQFHLGNFSFHSWRNHSPGFPRKVFQTHLSSVMLSCASCLLFHKDWGELGALAVSKTTRGCSVSSVILWPFCHVSHPHFHWVLVSPADPSRLTSLTFSLFFSSQCSQTLLLHNQSIKQKCFRNYPCFYMPVF